MANTVSYDPDEHLFSPSFDAAYRVLSDTNSPDLFDLSNSNSPPFSDPSQNSSNSSPPESKLYSPRSLDTYPEPNFLGDGIDDSLLREQINEKLQIIAQPKAFYRERYCSETDPTKHRAQRFIRADDDTCKYEYPTVQIPTRWRNLNRNLYIRVTLVTVFSEKVPVVCIHPYSIDTQEVGVLRNVPNNSLYFPITPEEIMRGEKSFRISRKKMTQHDLRSYGLLRLFDLNQHDIQRVLNIHDAKQIIETYQLWKSQLVFTVAERSANDHFPSIVPMTSVTSQIMCDEASLRRKDSLMTETLPVPVIDEDTVICTPRKGNWNGGDELLLVIPKLDRRKEFNLYFDYGAMGQLNSIRASFVDMKTIFFETPSCAVLPGEQNLAVPIVVTQNDMILARVEFVYLAPTKTNSTICSRCQLDIMNTNNNINNQTSNKRRYLQLEPIQFDGGEELVRQMSLLTTKEKPVPSNKQSNNEESNSKFDKYLKQLQEAVVSYVRTNNPSKLFRRTRLLIAKWEEDTPPLDDAIRNGHIDLALRLIEQTVDMPSASNNILQRENDDGQNSLLLAAKLNHWILMEPILNKRPDLLEKTDKSGNNILHLLAMVSEDRAVETIENISKLIPDDLKAKLLDKKNQDKQTPKQIAQTEKNTQCASLLVTS